jgi:hypothetical protein
MWQPGRNTNERHADEHQLAAVQVICNSSADIWGQSKNTSVFIDLNPATDPGSK